MVRHNVGGIQQDDSLLTVTPRAPFPALPRRLGAGRGSAGCAAVSSTGAHVMMRRRAEKVEGFRSAGQGGVCDPRRK